MYALGMQAQSSGNMSDSEVMDYIVSEHNKGTSQSQIVTKLMQRGVSINQIRSVRNMYEKMQTGAGVNAKGQLGVTTTATGNRTRMNSMEELNARQNVKDRALDPIAEHTRTTTAQEKLMMNKYSTEQLRMYRQGGHTYNSYDEEYLAMYDEMNDWLPQDTAVMYRQLLRKLQKEAAEKNRKKVFGRDLFSFTDLTFEPELNIATPQSYVLGPGDAVYIDVYGASQRSFEGTVSPDGDVNIDGFGPIQVSGLTVSQASARVRAILGKRYQGSQIKLTLGQTRTITVNVMGEVLIPGSYTMSSFGTVFHALHMAGGIGDLGTLRNIKVYRGGTLVSVVDVYDYMLNGKLTGNVKLADNDVIVVGTYDSLVNITGKVKRPMFYEMKSNESLGTLLRYAGGFKGEAYTKSVRVVRRSGREYSIFNVNEFDVGSFTIADNDSVIVDSVLARYENMVELKGAVFRPGKYQVGGDINSVRSLLEAADGTTEEAFTAHGIIHREKPDKTLEVIQVNIDGIMDGSVPDIPLQSNDVFFVPTRSNAMRKSTVAIQGEITYPGVYMYADNLTIEDLILQAGGLKESASTSKVTVSRRMSDPTAVVSDSITAQNFSFAVKDGYVVDGEVGFTLKPNDRVYVYKSPGYVEQKTVKIDGEVIFSGYYTLEKVNARLSDLVKESGGVNDMAYIKGARLMRKTNEVERMQMAEIMRQASENEQRNMLRMALGSANPAAVAEMADRTTSNNLSKFNIPAEYPVGIELDKALANPGCESDIILREGDRLIIPQYNGTVRINGAVMYTNTVGFLKGKKVSYYIDQAGGFASDAKKSETYIVYMNGMVAKVGHNAKVMPGCEIIVPTKAQSKMTIAEKMAMATSFSSIATMMATLRNILK
jgi:protein involved in polysaccharide export with SLBB domain